MLWPTPQSFLKLFLNNDQSNPKLNVFGYTVKHKDTYHRVFGISPDYHAKGSATTSDPLEGGKICTMVRTIALHLFFAVRAFSI